MGVRTDLRLSGSLTLSLSTVGVSVCQVTQVTTAATIWMTARTTAVRTEPSVWMKSTAMPASVLKATGEFHSPASGGWQGSPRA